jgi:hypothetical protein
MNQNDIKEFLSLGNTNVSFDSFNKDPSKGWYAHGKGAETRAESESRAATFYTWLCEYLDFQLQSNDYDLFDAGVALDSEVGEHEHDKFGLRQRRRRTALLIGHGDFMSLILKRIVSGFGHAVGKLSTRITSMYFATQFSSGMLITFVIVVVSPFSSRK